MSDSLPRARLPMIRWLIGLTAFVAVPAQAALFDVVVGAQLVIEDATGLDVSFSQALALPDPLLDGSGEASSDAVTLPDDLIIGANVAGNVGDTGLAEVGASVVALISIENITGAPRILDLIFGYGFEASVEGDTGDVIGLGEVSLEGGDISEGFDAVADIFGLPLIDQVRDLQLSAEIGAGEVLEFQMTAFAFGSADIAPVAVPEPWLGGLLAGSLAGLALATSRRRR